MFIRFNGSGSLYLLNNILTCAVQVTDVESAILSRYLTISFVFVWGFDQIFQKREKISIWTNASIGASPSKKYSGIIGDHLPSFNIPLRTLWWKFVKILIVTGLIGSADRPDLNTGETKIDQT